MTFDSVINAIIVPIIVLFFLYIFRDPLIRFFTWMGDIFSWGKSKFSKSEEEASEIPNLKWEE